MDSNNELTYKQSVSKRHKAMGIGLGILSCLGGAFFLYITLGVSRASHWSIGLIPLYPALLFLLLGVGMFRNKQVSYTSVKRITKEGFYHYFLVPEQEKETEQLIPYKKMTALYLGRVVEMVMRQDRLTKFFAHPLLVFRWEEDGVSHYRGVVLKQKEWPTALRHLPAGLPVYSTPYDLTQYPDDTLGDPLADAEYYRDSGERFPYPYELGYVKQKELPKYIPDEVAEKKKRCTRLREMMAGRLLGGWLVLNFLLAVLWMPSWKVVDELFVGLWPVVLIILTMILVGAVYARLPLEWRNMLLVGRHMLFVIAVYGGGGYLGYLLFSETPRHLDAVVNHSLLSFWSIPAAFLLSKFLYLLGVLMYAALLHSGFFKGKTKPRRNIDME